MPPLNRQTAYKQNRLQQLRGFCYTALTGSVSRAAEKLLLSQPSVSQQIKALEREFGAALIERHGRSVKLTSEGELLYKMAEPLVQSVDTLHHEFSARRDQVEGGRLDIAAGESTILYILPKYVKAFITAHPGIDLKLHNVTGREGLAMLRARDADLAIGSMIDPHDDMDYEPIFSFNPVLITARNHPLAKRKRVTMEEVASYPLILPPRNLTTFRIVDAAFRQRGLKYEVRLEAGGWEVIKKYVELNLGISLVTNICLTGRERLAVLPLGKHLPRRTYGVVLAKNVHHSPQARRFIELMHDPELARKR